MRKHAEINKLTTFFPQNLPKVLIVDDKAENLLALERLLKNLPLQLYRATSGNEALRLTLHHDFAFALLDIQMPEMDGYELADILRHEEKTAQMPIIFISAIYTDSNSIFQGYKKGAFSFITKPFDPEVLLSKVRFFVEKYQQEEILKLRTIELQQSNEELEAFSYSVSHDLRAPLRAIGGFSKVLQKKLEGKLDEEQERYLNIVMENVGKMDKLIDDLLAFSRMSRMALNASVFDLELLVQGVFNDLVQGLDRDRIKLIISELPRIKADREMMKHLLFNLLGNAIKYSSKKEEAIIEVGYKKEAGENVFFVKDNGAGFEMEYADKLFGVFQRLHTEDEFEGTGVGLAIVERILHRHNGRIWASSEPGKGATFFFTIPQ